MRLIAVAHGPPIDSYCDELKDYNGRHLTRKDFDDFLRDLPGGTVCVEHDTNAVVGTIEYGFVDSFSGALKVVFEVHEEIKDGADAADRVESGELWAVSLHYKHPILFLPDATYGPKKLLELSLTSRPERPECVITHFERAPKKNNEFLFPILLQRVSSSYKQPNPEPPINSQRDASMNTSQTPPLQAQTQTQVPAQTQSQPQAQAQTQPQMQTQMPTQAQGQVPTQTTAQPPAQTQTQNQNQTQTQAQPQVQAQMQAQGQPLSADKRPMAQNPHTLHMVGASHGIPDSPPSGITMEQWKFMVEATNEKANRVREETEKVQKEKQEKIEEQKKRLNDNLVKNLNLMAVSQQKMEQDNNPHAKDVKEKLMPNFGKWANDNPETAFLMLEVASASNDLVSNLNKQNDELKQQLDLLNKERDRDNTKFETEKKFFQQFTSAFLPTPVQQSQSPWGSSSPFVSQAAPSIPTASAPWASTALPSFPSAQNWTLQTPVQQAPSAAPWSLTSGQGQGQMQAQSQGQIQGQIQNQGQGQQASWPDLSAKNSRLSIPAYLSTDVTGISRSWGALSDPKEKQYFAGFGSEASAMTMDEFSAKTGFAFKEL